VGFFAGKYFLQGSIEECTIWGSVHVILGTLGAKWRVSNEVAQGVRRKEGRERATATLSV
jgi:hypothetical protein